MRKKCGELASGFAGSSGNQRYQLAVEPSFADEKPRGDGDAYPAILQNIDGEGGTAGGEIAIDPEIIVDASESGINGRRFGIALGGVGPVTQGTVVVYGDDHPSGGVRNILSATWCSINE
jgi:hypothetical protein